jgi:hypothetical protein
MQLLANHNPKNYFKILFKKQNDSHFQKEHWQPVLMIFLIVCLESFCYKLKPCLGKELSFFINSSTHFDMIN